MKERHKAYLKINITSVIFIAISFISVTLAWFAYSGLASVETEIGVKAWYIELDKNGNQVSNDIVISLSEIYPGMDVVHEVINIKNLGDSDAQVNYSIISARILDDVKDNYIIDETNVKSEIVEDILSHDYPFHININLTQNYALSKGKESSFEVSISWPLDSDTDQLDSYWGMEAYKFQTEEENRKRLDENYQIRPSIQIVISLVAEQYLNSPSSSDFKYNLGDMVLFDVVNNKPCLELSETCISTYVINKNNKLSDEYVSLLPNPKSIYLSESFHNYDTAFNSVTDGWQVETRPLLVDDVLKITSTDVMSSYLIRPNISNSIIGKMDDKTRIDKEINKVINYSGKYSFINEKFQFISTANCYWTKSQYATEFGFAVKKITESNSEIYAEYKSTSCNIIPVILANKNDLNL